MFWRTQELQGNAEVEEDNYNGLEEGQSLSKQRKLVKGKIIEIY